MAQKDMQVRRNSRTPTMFDMMPEFEQMMEHFFDPRQTTSLWDWPVAMPRTMMHVRENEKGYMLSTEIPGVPPEDVEISVDGNMLTIKAEKNDERTSDHSQRQRRQYRSFQKSVSLPSTVDAERIEAHYDNGVLEVLLPKTPQSQPRRIEIQNTKSIPMNEDSKGMAGTGDRVDATSKH